MKRHILIIALLFASLGMPTVAFSQVMDSPPRDGGYDKAHTQNRMPIPYAHLREADVLWQNRIWRVIDFRQKINHQFYYPEEPHNGWRNFMTVIMEALKEGTITAYQFTPTDEFTIPLTYQEILKAVSSVDTVQDFERPDGTFVDTVFVNEFNTQEIKKIRVKEDWFFDKQRSQMDVRIIGICPLRDVVKSATEKYTNPMFWLYYPDIRPVLAQAEVFNRFNDAERRSFEDIFWKRMFDSYIIKEKNVYDRTISEYATGLDALLESERIQNNLFTVEHDLWEF